MQKIKKKPCPCCNGTGEVTDQTDLHNYIQRYKDWLYKNIRKGSIILIGKSARKVVSINDQAIIEMVKLSPGGWYPRNDTTTQDFYSYYKRFHGVLRKNGRMYTFKAEKK